MVSRESATGGRYPSDPTSIFAIERDHSTMVKLQEEDLLIPILVDKIRSIETFTRPGDSGIRSMVAPDSSQHDPFLAVSADAQKPSVGIRWIENGENKRRRNGRLG